MVGGEIFCEISVMYHFHIMKSCHKICFGSGGEFWNAENPMEKLLVVLVNAFGFLGYFVSDRIATYSWPIGSNNL